MNTPTDQTPPEPPPSAPEPEISGRPGAEQRQWAMFAHLSALLGFVFPFGSLIGPLVIWLIKKDTMPFVDDQAKEALNFQITVALAIIVCFVLMLVLIGFFLLWAVVAGALVFVIVAAVKANDGETYRYPFTLRLVK